MMNPKEVDSMPPMLIAVLVLLIIFSWFLIGEEKSFGEKVGVLLVFLGLYTGYKMLNGASFQDIFLDPLIYFFKRL